MRAGTSSTGGFKRSASVDTQVRMDWSDGKNRPDGPLSGGIFPERKEATALCGQCERDSPPVDILL